MAPFEAFYWRKCHTSLSWNELSEKCVVGPELIQEIEDKFKLVKDQLKVVFYRQKSYADLKRREVEYAVGDLVFLKVSPWKKVLYFGHKVDEVEVSEDISYEEKHVQILARDVKVLWNKVVPLVKVLWRNHNTEEATWETEELMRAQFSH
ncbi:uncharacterized protein LOC120187708 [Hibiscus syriacus]|uniref:uncharacterized protein LOC120187708 n=1 Tax=Hibiscus syriacus TaxID=106335 RepID=UPI0019204249|nr:uncharacterized protein LOC120187708 [Hibiscus syriacus]